MACFVGGSKQHVPVLLVVLQDVLARGRRGCCSGGGLLFLPEHLLRIVDPHPDDAADHNCGGAQGPDPQDLETGALLAPPGHHWRSGSSLKRGESAGDFSLLGE
ncbi:uncharacterized protein LOC133889619 [Phragmites australis]|uniref:uncharacterized protein LOC133889619 n=1 Tax=Phragmites australis TaxID=29695 RepID=UPI002D79C94C|nr:uncharacterized protein LOC133889619 [Phragmites australis]